MTDVIYTYGPLPRMWCVVCRMIAPLPNTSEAAAGLVRAHVHNVAICGWSPSCLPPQAREAARSYVLGSGEGT